MDMGYGIPWGNTAPGESLLQSCGASYTGKCRKVTVARVSDQSSAKFRCYSWKQKDAHLSVIDHKRVNYQQISGSSV